MILVYEMKLNKNDYSRYYSSYKTLLKKITERILLR